MKQTKKWPLIELQHMRIVCTFDLFTSKKMGRDFFLFLFYFLNYESMITHLQETWKIQNKVTYSSTTGYSYFLSG